MALLLAGFTLALALAPCSTAQSNFEVKNNTVAPEFGYGDFTYSAQIWLSGSASDLSGKFRMELRIYEGDDLIYSESSLERRLSMEEIQMKLSEPFVFGPYSFKDKFGISSTANASYEFIIYRYGRIVGRSKANGPIVRGPEIMGSPQYDATPYFFQGLSASASFRDMEGLNPTCHLEIKGPLNAAGESSWTTGEVSCTSSGKNIYTCTQQQDFQTYRDGGNFSFNVVYNNLRFDPLILGPYNFTILPYSPRAERLVVPQLLDYTNFTISAYIKDEGVKMVGGSPIGSSADLIISHPRKGEAVYSSNSPKLQGGYLVFDWDRTSIPFSRSDVSISRDAPFQARIEYRNENWNYGAESEAAAFAVVEEVPRLEVRYDPVVYVRSGETATQDISAVVSFSKGQGDMRFHLSGPAQDISHVEKGISIDENRYQYNWKMSFDERHINRNYTISMAFLHPSLEGGEFAFDDKYIQVVPVLVQFQESTVSPSSGRWNDSYTYSLDIDSSVDLDVMLETYDPCSRDWKDTVEKRATAGQSALNWTLTPFYYDCPEMASVGAMYRFKAEFAGVDYESRPYSGPSLRGGNPGLVSLDYIPVLYVVKDGVSYQIVRAIIDSTLGRAKVGLEIRGPNKNFEQQSEGDFLDGTRYIYSWSVPFTTDNIGNHTISLRYIHPEIDKGSVSFPEQSMIVIEEESERALPQLLYLDYLPILFIEDSEVHQNITAEVYSSSGKGDLRFDILGPGKNVSEIVRGDDKGDDVYVYHWSEPFSSSSEGKSFRISLTYLIDGESYYLDDSMMSVVRKNSAPSQIWEPTLSLEYDRTLFIPEGGRADQIIRATINYTEGMGLLGLNLTGPDKDIYELKNGQDLGNDRYLYKWSIPFTGDNVGKEYRISLTYYHSSLTGGEYRFADKDMRVVSEPGGKDVIRFSNASVTPSSGSGLTGFTYCVDIETELKEANVQLLTSDPESTTFKAQYIVHYDGSNKTLCWPDVAINSNQKGNAGYKFLSGSSSSRSYPGPVIKTIEASGNVDPRNGVIQGFEGDNALYSFTYTLEIENMSVNLSPWIELLVRSPNSSWRTVGGMKQYDPSKGLVSWTEKPFTNAPFLDEAEFKFRIDGLETQSFKGPKIVAVYDEPGWVETGPNKYSYWAWFEASEDLTIDLLHSSDGQHWIKADKPKTYEANSGRIKIDWPDEPGYNKFEFEIKIEDQGGAP